VPKCVADVIVVVNDAAVAVVAPADVCKNTKR